MSMVTEAQVNEMVAELFPGSGTSCAEIGDDFAVAALQATDANIRPGGFISGPTQFAVIDSAFWFACFAGLGRVEPMALTSELSIRFLRPAQGSVLYCRAVVESVSRRSVVLSGRTWVDDRVDKITSIGQGTYAIPLPR